MAAIKRVILPSVPVMLAEGTEVFVEDGSGGLDLYIGNSSNTPVLVSANQFANQDSVVDVSDIVNDLTTGGTNVPLSAEQGKVLDEDKANKDDVVLKDSGQFESDKIVNFADTPLKNFDMLKFVGSTTPNLRGKVILLGLSDTAGSQRITLDGFLFGYSRGDADNRNNIVIELKSYISGNNASGGTPFPNYQINIKYSACHGAINDIRIITCDYNGANYVALFVGGTTAFRYPDRWYFMGRSRSQNDPLDYPAIVEESSVSNITTETSGARGRNVWISAVNEFTGNIEVGGTVTASDFITASRVESDQENALQALDNIAEWKKKDGSVDYEKHYAYKTREVKDEEGKVIRTEFGLSMEKRVAMLEKMVYELREENRSLKTQPGEKK